jgi:hypothetical protein
MTTIMKTEILFLPTKKKVTVMEPEVSAAVVDDEDFDIDIVVPLC